MTSGIKWTEDETEYEIEDQSHWLQAILNLPTSSPGKRYKYSTGDSHLLSAVLTHATGKSTCDYANEKLFGPLGVKAKRWGRDPQGYYSGGYNVYLTPRELAKLGLLYLKRGEWNGQQIIPQSWVNQSWEKHQKVDSVFSYGYLWWLLSIDGYDIYKMWGFGGQFVYVIPALDLVTVITFDTKHDHDEPDGDDFIKNYLLPTVS